MAKPRGTDGSLLSSLPWTLASLALALLPHVQYLPIWITGAFFACALWRTILEKRRGTLPSPWLRAALALSCFLGVFVTYETISGVGPGSALLAIMAALKLLETRERRDQFVLLFIAIFLVMSSLLREQYLWSLPYLLATLLFIMTAWLRMSGDPQEPVRQSFQTAGRLVAYAIPLALVMWFLFPRISTPFWAVPVDTSSGVTGLNDSMSPGDITSLSQSDEVAFRVRFSGAVPPPRERYWRALVLHRYNGRTWTGSDGLTGNSAEQQVRVSGAPVEYQVTLEPTRQHWVPALEMPYRWDLQRTSMGRMQELWRIHPIDQRVIYTVESYTEYRAEADLGQYFQRWYLDLPDGSNPRTQAMANDMRRAAGSNERYINAVLQQFNDDEYFYTLQPPGLGRNPVDQFLFDTRQGFCEHYASAFTVLMRAAGIPARVVLGYQGGEVNPMGAYMIVRQSDAHAWSEVWLEGRGWVRVDPTAAVAPERIDLGFTDSMMAGAGSGRTFGAATRLLHRAQLTWDALNASWNEWVLGYGPDKQSSLMQKLGMQSPDWQKLMLSMIAVVVIMTVAISYLLMRRYRPPPRDPALLLYERFVQKTGVAPRTGESPGAFARRAIDSARQGPQTIQDITATYLDTRYGNNPDRLTELRQKIAAMR